MSSTWRAAKQVSGRARRWSVLPAIANTRSCGVKLEPPASTTTRRGSTHEQKGRAALLTATYSTCTNIAISSISGGSNAAASKSMPRPAGASLEQQRSLSCGIPRRHTDGSCQAASSLGPTRMFGGQSVVPWELALFLIEEVRTLNRRKTHRFSPRTTLFAVGIVTLVCLWYLYKFLGALRPRFITTQR